MRSEQWVLGPSLFRGLKVGGPLLRGLGAVGEGAGQRGRGLGGSREGTDDGGEWGRS